MAKYLRKFGHEVTILTHSYHKDYLDKEDNVIRIFDISHNRNRTGVKRIIWLMLRLITEFLNFIGCYHSIYFWWKKRVLKYKGEIITILKPELIIATYPPIETLEIALEFSQLFNIPFLSDFRDGLLFESIEDSYIQRYKVIKARYSEIEYAIARKSSAITAVSQPISEYFREKYKINNVMTILNGFDSDDFKKLPVNIKLDQLKFNLVFTGRFSLSDEKCRTEPFFDAVRKLSDKNELIKNKLQIHLLGEYTKKELAMLRDLIDKNMVIFHGLVERSYSLAYQKRADLLLIITQPERRSVITSKFFEYIFTGNPILSITSGTVLEEIAMETKTGWIIHPNDSQAIQNMLEKILVDKHFYNSLKPDQEKIQKYSFKAQIKRLDNLLFELFVG